MHPTNDHPIAVFAPSIPRSNGTILSALLAVLRGYRPLEPWMVRSPTQTRMSALMIANQQMYFECVWYRKHDPDHPLVQVYIHQWELMHALVQAHPWSDADRAGLVQDYDVYRTAFFARIAWCAAQPTDKEWDTEFDWEYILNMLSIRDCMQYLGPQRFATPEQWASEAVMLNVAMLLAIPPAFRAYLPSWATPQGRYQSIINPPFWWHFREGYASDEWSHW